MSAPTDASPTAPDLEKLNSFPDDCLSPEGEYKSRDELVSVINVWYESLPAGSLKTNQAYRGAMGLPQRYSKETYAWFQDYNRWVVSIICHKEDEDNGRVSQAEHGLDEP
ncbi:transposase [Fusarium albosuccineum]|uniref:Transposase n=1 Tax=Fusarium albosuccineum TaxID=1237068 RepID=A0A8H4LBH6_9HYPO|nr:transposase [Fusarium albosuccineum]